MRPSSNKVKIGLVQMKMARSRSENLAKAIRMVGEAASKGAQIVCLPELFAWQYFPQEKKSDEKPIRMSDEVTRSLSGAAKDNQVVLVGGSVYERSGHKAYNTTLLFDESGKILGKYRKVHVPQDQSFYEQNYFTRGSRFRVFNTKYCKVGLLICFDQWYPEAARIEKLMGADIIFYPTAIGWVKGIDPVEGNWKKAWEDVQIGHAISNSIIVAAVNRVGVEREMTFWGGSFVSDQFGKVLVRGGNKEGIFVGECDLCLGKNIENGWGFLRNRSPGSYRQIPR